MIVHDVDQNTDEWFQLRLGIPSASEFDKLITSSGSRSKQLDAYANRLVAERLTGSTGATKPPTRRLTHQYRLFSRQYSTKPPTRRLTLKVPT